MECVASDGSSSDEGKESDDHATLNGVASLYHDDDEIYDSEREWREAVRAAVEAEIQYQVHLRLSLGDQATAATPSYDSEQEQTKQLLVRCHRPKRPRPKRKRKRALADSPTHSPQQESDAIGGNGADVDPRSQQRRALAVPGPQAPSTASCNMRIIAQTPGRECPPAPQEPPPPPLVRAKSEQPRVQSLQEYLHSKYGVPLSHLQHWSQHGRFICKPPGQQLAPGVDTDVRWPVERELVHSTPQLPANEIDSGRLPLNVPSPPPPARSPSPTRTEAPAPADRAKVVYSTDDGDSVSPGGDGEPAGLLRFESRFESGNLRKAVKIGPHEYDLVLNADLYNERHTQWFYFRVTGMEVGITYSFNILNLQKKDSLYNHGMKLLLYSEIGGGWTRSGHDFSYQKLDQPYYGSWLPRLDIDYYCLSWKMEFPCAGDTCYFSHCYPYPFTQLLSLLRSIDANMKKSRYVKTEVLCESLAGNPCHLLTISDFKRSENILEERPAVVFTARVHPGESNSSWMMQGIIDFLTSEHKHAKYLRGHYLFKLIPMLNPDGVIVGNYRTSLSGVDLNRTYKNPHAGMFPTVYYTKQLISNLMEERKIALYVDLHGHSRNQNVFMYGCHTPKCSPSHFLKERLIPWLLAQMSGTKFSFKSCKFSVKRCKASTSRVVMWRMGLHNSFTMEASFCGTTLTKPDPLHFTQEDLMTMGRELCHVLVKLHRYNTSSSYQHKVDSNLAEYLVQQFSPDEPKPEGAAVSSSLVETEAVSGGALTTGGRRERRKRMSRSLQQLHTMDPHLMEAESSTSGSDSDNDDFALARKKPKGKRHKHRGAAGLVPGLAASKQAGHLLERGKPLPLAMPAVNQMGLKCQEKEAGDLKSIHHRRDGVQHVSSAPPRLEGAIQLNSAHGWRFVSKYANRSGGGFPIFSEERVKERAEKLRLRSLSMIEETEVSEVKSDDVADFTESLVLPRLPGVHSQWSSSRSLPWPGASQRQRALLEKFGKRPLTDKSTEVKGERNDSPYSPVVACNGVNGLTERKRLLPAAAVESRHSRSPRSVHALALLRTPSLHHPTSHATGMGLSPQLMKYISEMWRKYVQDYP